MRTSDALGTTDHVDSSRGGARPKSGAHALGERLGSVERALADYRHLMKSAPPEAVESASAEAVTSLSDLQRERLLHELAEAAARDDRDGIERTSKSDVANIALHTTRAEVRDPGWLQRTFGKGGESSALLLTFVAAFVASPVAQQYLEGHPAPKGLDVTPGHDDVTGEYEELADEDILDDDAPALSRPSGPISKTMS